jgi:hypothetical protein
MSSNDSYNTRDLMENSYYYFNETLSILSKSPVEQCTAMGDYNVAFELRDDGLLVDNFIGQEIIEFTPDQLEGMKKLSSVLSELSDEALKGGHTREDNLKGISNPEWQLVRETAKNLMKILDSRTIENRKYLKMQ